MNRSIFKLFSFLLVFSVFGTSFAFSPENLLVQAVETGNYSECVQLINAGANYNYHGVYDPNDFSSSDWSVLMKAIARLGSLIIEAQSFINTTDSVFKDVVYPVNIASIATSAYLKNPMPFLATAVSSGIGWKAGLYYTKQVFDKKIEEQYKIVQLLLAQSNIEMGHASMRSENAETLCLSIDSLLRSHYLSPPFVSKQPEQYYVTMMGEILYKITDGHEAVRMIRNDEYVRRLAASAERFLKPNASYEKITDTLPIVFDPGYNITFFGLENLHPFDTKKYGKIAQYLHDQFPEHNFFAPESVSLHDLQSVHTKEYLELIKKPHQIGFIADMPILCLLPYRLVERLLMQPVMKAVGGTLKAVELAKKYGLSINLSGGYHHAKTNDPVYGGFCLINDACIAAKKLLQLNPEYKILIIDLDAHQGNGNAEAVKYEKNIAIFDMYNNDTWPGDFQTQERINFPILLSGKMDDIAYLLLLEKYLPRVIDAVKPDFIIYNAGTDIYEHDPLGCLSVSADGINARDEIVFREATSRNVPITMILSGGYHKDSATIIGKSVVNVLQRFLTK